MIVQDRMKPPFEALRVLLIFLCAFFALATIAQPQDELSKKRTGPGGSNQAAGPGGQHPGPVGEVPGGTPKPEEHDPSPTRHPETNPGADAPPY